MEERRTFIVGSKTHSPQFGNPRICGCGKFMSCVVTMRRRRWHRRFCVGDGACEESVLEAAMAMAVTCSASSFSALSSSSFQGGSGQEFARLAFGSGSYGSRECGVVQVRAGKGPPKQGRGYNSKKAAADGIRKIMRGREADNAFDGWTQVLMQEELPEGKNKAVIHNNAGYVLVKKDDQLYAIQANCTSCKFPIIEGKVDSAEGAEDGAPGAAQIECPLCHTKFSLEDGKVVEYCPKDGPLAWAIGTLKSKEVPVDAKVYSARISKSGRVSVRFASPGPVLP